MGEIIYMPAGKAVLRQHGLRGVRLNDESRKIFISGSSGSGKTVLEGHIVWGDLIRGVPQIVIDPHGPLIDSVLGKITRKREKDQRRIWLRVEYVDWSGKSGFVKPFPLYYRMSETDTLAEIALRPLEIFLKLDPELQTASILGWNALKHAGKYMGMMVAALGLQVSEGLLMLNNPRKWIARLRQAAADNPELEPALVFFEELAHLKAYERKMETSSLVNKLSEFSDDPRMKAMYDASQPHFDLENIVAGGKTLLLDFRHVLSLERRRFGMMHAFNYIMDYIKARGAGRHKPISIVIDELTALFPIGGMAGDQFALEIDAMINQYVRNYRVWACLSSQALYQFPERLQKTLLNMPTQIYGAASNPGDAELLAEQFIDFDPEWNRRHDPVWMSGMFGNAYIVDFIPVPFSVEEQLKIQSQHFRKLRPFEFYARIPIKEGSLRAPLIKMEIALLDRNLWPNAELVSRARELLMKRYGRTLSDVHQEIRGRSGIEELKDLPQLFGDTPASRDALDEDEIEELFWSD